MKFDHALCLAGLIAFSGALHAESCAGGVGGGMDATGNECNDASWQTDASASVASPVAAPTVAPNVRPAERKVSGLVKAAGKPPAVALAGVEERHLPKRSPRASPPVPSADRQPVVERSARAATH